MISRQRVARPATEEQEGSGRQVEPNRHDLRWSLVVDDDVLDVKVRTTEFSNWIANQVLAPIPFG
jgi:hypothetical protein